MRDYADVRCTTASALSSKVIEHGVLQGHGSNIVLDIERFKYLYIGY